MKHRQEIIRLFKVEYGTPSEVFLRYVAIFVGGFTLYFYLQWSLALVWMVGNFLLQLLYYSYLQNRMDRDRCTAMDTRIAAIIYLVMLVWFTSMPTVLILNDDLAMQISAASGIGCLLIFMLRRADTLDIMIYGEIALIVLMVVGVNIAAIPKVEDLNARFAMGVIGFVMIVYFANALLAGRQQRLDAEAAALRSNQSQKMEAVGQLAGGVAHDFNNILTAVIGNLDLYEVIEDPTERAELIGNARHAAERAASLIQQLLAYSRKSHMRPAAHQVTQILMRVHTLAQRLIPSSVQMTVVPPRRDLWVSVDETQLMTALINLIVNARDAMPKGGKLRVSCATRVVSAPEIMADGQPIMPGEYIQISVADSGPGIPPDIMDNVLEPFFTTKPVGEGSGLGLSMVAGFARQSGGGVMIESSSQGACISILLASCAPFVPEAEAAQSSLGATGMARARPENAEADLVGIVDKVVRPVVADRRGPLL